MSGREGRNGQLNKAGFGVRGLGFGFKSEIRNPKFEIQPLSLLLLSILYMASLGLVCPSTSFAAGAPAGSTLSLGGDAGSAQSADQPGDVIWHATTALGNDTVFQTTQNTLTSTVSPVHGDTLANFTGGGLTVAQNDTVWISLAVTNKGNGPDTIFLDSGIPSGPAAPNMVISFWNSAGTAPISNRPYLNADVSLAFRIAVHAKPSAAQGDNITFALVARAKNGLGGDTGGYIGNDGFTAYAGKGDDSSSISASVGVPSPSDGTRLAFSGDTHVLADTSNRVVFTIIVKNDTGLTVPNAPVSVNVTYPSPSYAGAPINDASVQTSNGLTDASGRVTCTVTLGPASSFYRIKAQANPGTGGPARDFYAYNDRLRVAESDTTPGVGWRMWSPNKNPSPTSTVADVIQSDLGGDAKVYEWVPTVTDDAFKKYRTPSAIVRGRAYWVKNFAGGGNELSVPGPVISDTVIDTLSGKGWHQVGSGQHYFVDWDYGVEFSKADTYSFLPPASAAIYGWIKNAIYWRDDVNNSYRWGPDSAGPSNIPSVQVKPMAGFWLWVDTDITLVMRVRPQPVVPNDSAEILTQAPRYLSATYGENPAAAGNEASWAVQLVAQSGSVSDLQNYIGVRPSAEVAARSSLYEPPSVASGYLTLGVRDPENSGQPLSAAAYAAPIATAKSWNLEVYSDLNSPVTLTWDNIAALPQKYVAYLSTPTGTVDLRKSSSYVLAAGSGAAQTVMTLAVGLPEYASGLLAAPLAKEESFAYPNPGPDNTTGLMYFKHNVTSGEVKLQIFDMGGKLVRQIIGTTSPIQWDTTNRHGQKVGSGVYIYMLESGGNKLVDKLAIVR